MIYFTKIRWKNFLSTGNIFTEIDLAQHKTTLVVGENGAGKSTFLDALTFSLFGKPFRNINKPLLVNSITQKNLVVEIEFTIGKVNYKVVRGIKPSVFEVYQNDTLLNQTAETKDYQAILEKQILKTNYKSFCQVVVLGSASYVPFMRLTAAQRREITEDLLDLQLFTTMNAILKDKISDNSEAIRQCNNDIALAKEHIELLRKHIININNSNEKNIEEKKQRIVDTNNKIEEYAKDLQKLNSTVASLQKKVERLPKIKKSLQSMDNLKTQIQIKLDLMNEEVHFFNNHDDCPTCKQQISEDFKCDSINKRKTEITETQEGYDLLLQKYNSTKEQINELIKIEDEIMNNKFTINTTQNRINSLLDYVNEIQKEIKSMKVFEMNDEDQKIKNLEITLQEYSEKYNEFQSTKVTYAFAATLLKDNGIKSKIVKQCIPILNKLINKYLSSMEFMCQFELDENFSETIKSRYRDEFKYESFSEGEKFRINLAILFTWRAIAKMRNSINTNLLIMDEVMDSSLDNNGTDEFLKLINNLTKDTNTFIISHKKDTIIDKFDHSIKFEKYQNFSRIAA